MKTYSLPNGREIFLVRWNMMDTYSGVYEGSRETASEHLRKDLKRRAKSVLNSNLPIAVIEPPAGELPAWMCVAYFDSYAGTIHTDPDFNSRLLVCWFFEDTNKSLDEIITSILPFVDWENLAQEYDLMDSIG